MKIRIVKGAATKFPYSGDKEFVNANLGKEFEAKRTCLNYYKTACGHFVHVYNGFELSENN